MFLLNLHCPVLNQTRFEPRNPQKKKKQQQETKNKKMKKIKCEKLLEIGLAAVKLEFEDKIKAKEQCGQKN